MKKLSLKFFSRCEYLGNQVIAFARSFHIHLAYHKFTSRLKSPFVKKVLLNLSSPVREFCQSICQLKLQYRVVCLFILVGLIGLGEFFFAQKEFPRNQPTFIRQLAGPWVYQAKIPTVNLTTSLGINKKQAKIEVARNESALQMTIPLENSKIREEKNQLVYTIPEKQIEVRYQLIEKGLKEEIVLNKKPASGELISELNLKNLEVKITPEGIPVFFDSQTDKYQFHFQKPFAKDNKGNVTYDIEIKLIPVFKNTLSPLPTAPLENPNEIRFQGKVKKELFGIAKATEIQVEKYQLALRLNQDWLSDPQRIYPIIIDPTVVHDTTAEFASGTFNRIKDIGSGSSPYLEDFQQELNADIHTVGFWHLNNNWNDASGNGNNGSASGNATFTSLSKLGSHAGTFDGNGDYASFGTSVTLDLTSPFTISTWVKLGTSGLTNAYVLTKRTAASGDNYAIIYGFNAGKYEFYSDLYTGTAPRTAFNTSVSDLNWHHIAWTYDGVTLKGYLDGVEDVSSAKTFTLGSTSSTFRIGTSTGSAGFFNGQVDEVRVSKIVRSPEEIKQEAQRRPYAVYTSDVIDLSNVFSWNSLSWAEQGVQTGNGETLYSSSNLVSQWNFNEGIGASATVAAGSCGSSCQGTLSGFSDTSGEDVAVSSGWTENNKRWGGSALMFDGSNDYVSAGNPSALQITSTFSIELWLKSSRVSGTVRGLAVKGNGTGSDWSYAAAINTSEKFRIAINTGTCSSEVGVSRVSNLSVTDGQWHHLVGVYNSSALTLNVYVDGRLDNGALTGTVAAIGCNSSRNFSIGSYSDPGYYYYNNLDAVRIYTRALSTAEILANYQAGNIEFQTRSSADSSTWEDWKPFTNETQIDSMDGPYQYNTTDSGLVTYWPMDENVDNTCSGGANDACDKKGSNDGAATGTKIVDGKWGKARNFNGSSDYLSVGDNDSLDITSTFTIEAWVNKDQNGVFSTVVAKENVGAETTGAYLFFVNSSNKLRFTIRNVADIDDTGSKTITLGTWYHITITHSGTSYKFYVNGSLNSDITNANNATANSATLLVGRVGPASPAYYFDGSIDEIRIYSSELSSSSIFQHYQEGIEQLGFLSGSLTATTSGTLRAESNGSTKYTLGAPNTDGYTAALWHLEETSGTGAYIKDSTANANNGTPTGTSIVDGFYGKARSFVGASSQYISCGNGSSLSFGSGNFTISAWIKTTTTSRRTVASKFETVAGPAYNGYLFDILSTGEARISVEETGTTDYAYRDTSTKVNDGRWHHVAIQRSSTNVYLYVDGALDEGAQSGSGTLDGSSDTSTNFTIGYPSYSGSTYFDGYIDEVKVSNFARTADEIAEEYRAGRDHRIGRALSSTDLSSKTKVPFYIAADRPGTYLETTIGKSTYANYEPDSDTVGLWHLEEQSGSGTYIKDSSSYSNNLTPNGPPTFVQGKIGKARKFDGSSHYLNVADNSSFGWGTTLSASAWIYPTTSGDTTRTIVSQGRYNAAWTNTTFVFGTDSSPANSLFLRAHKADSSDCDINTSANDIAVNNWYFVTLVFDGTNAKIYRNGVLLGLTACSGTLYNSTEDVRVGAVGSGASGIGFYFAGTIDEVTLTKAALTADQINQAFEIGKRTHPTTIDFATTGLSSNLLTNSSDYEFAVATTSGLFKYDKVIVKENYDGTEYLAQGEVSSINTTTRNITVSSWDTGSTFPSGGYTANCTVFKWQREYFDVTGSLSTHRDGITRLTTRVTNGSQGANIWLDDFRHSSAYMTTSDGSTISSTAQRYFQYRTIFSTTDTAATSSAVTSVTVDYNENTAPATPTVQNNKYFDNAKISDTTPTFNFESTDTESEDLEYEIQVDDDYNFGSLNLVAESSTSSGFLNIENGGDTHPFTEDQIISFTVQAGDALTNGTTYWYRLRARDPGGSNTWSSWSTARSLTIDTSLSYDEWFQTTKAQFDNDTKSSVSTHTDGYVYLPDTQIDNADTASNWVSSDTAATTVSQETTIKQEGTGSVKAVTNGYSNWWNNSYNFRKQLTISAAAGNGVSSGYSVKFTASGADAADIYNDSLASGNDFRAAYYNGSTWTELDRDLVTFTSSSIEVWFKLQAAIAASSSDTNYYLYYGNSGAGSPPANKDNIYLLWDNFDSDTIGTKWQRRQGTASTIASGKLTIDATSADQKLTSISTFPRSSGIDIKVKTTFITFNTSNGYMSVAFYEGASDYIEDPAYYGLTAASNCRVYRDTRSEIGTAITDSLALSTQYTFESAIGSGGPIRYWRNGTLKRSESNNTDTTNFEVGFFGENAAKIEYDEVRVRQWVATEPTVSAGSEAKTSINDTITLTKSVTNLSSYNSITFWAYSSRTGSYLRFQMGEIASDEQTYDFSISSANTWEQKTWDISGISGPARDAITKFAFKVTNADSSFTFYFDDIRSLTSSGNITSPAIYYSWFSGATSWNQVKWNDDETYGDIKYKVYYTVSTACDTIIPDGALAGNSSGFDTSPVDISGLSTSTYSQICVKAFLTYSSGSPKLNDWGVSVNYITGPTTPVIQNYKYFDNAKINDTTPTFNFKSTDADSDDLEYEIQVDDDSNFGSLNLVAESSTSSGFLNTENGGDSAPFTPNQIISFTVQGEDALTNGTIYWYRLRAKDPGGSNTWSSWMTKRSFTIDTTLTRDEWFQTTKAQFDTDTLAGNAQTNAGGYVEVSSSTGTVTSTAIYYAGFDGAKKWQYLKFADDETYGDIKYSIYYDVGGTPTIVPDTVLPGNSAGFDTSPVDISGLPSNHYPLLYVRATLTYSGGTPTLNDWTVSAYDLQEPFLCNLSEGTGSLTLTWEDKSNDEDHFYIQRKVNSEAWTWINSPVANSTSYTDTSVANDNTYQYKVRGETNAGDPVTSWCETTPLILGFQNLTIKGGTRLEKINIYFK